MKFTHKLLQTLSISTLAMELTMPIEGYERATIATNLLVKRLAEVKELTNLDLDNNSIAFNLGQYSIELCPLDTEEDYIEIVVETDTADAVAFNCNEKDGLTILSKLV